MENHGFGALPYLATDMRHIVSEAEKKMHQEKTLSLIETHQVYLAELCTQIKTAAQMRETKFEINGRNSQVPFVDLMFILQNWGYTPGIPGGSKSNLYDMLDDEYSIIVYW
jgi:hypothetical protein